MQNLLDLQENIPFFIDPNNLSDEIKRDILKKKEELIGLLEKTDKKKDVEKYEQAKVVIEKIYNLLEISDNLKVVAYDFKKKLGGSFIIESEAMNERATVNMIYNMCKNAEDTLIEIDTTTGKEIRSRKGALQINLKLTENRVDELFNNLSNVYYLISSFQDELQEKLVIAESIISDYSETPILEDQQSSVLYVIKREGEYKEFYDKRKLFFDKLKYALKSAKSTLNYKNEIVVPSIKDLSDVKSFLDNNIERVMKGTQSGQNNSEVDQDKLSRIVKLKQIAEIAMLLRDTSNIKTEVSDELSKLIDNISLLEVESQKKINIIPESIFSYYPPISMVVIDGLKSLIQKFRALEITIKENDLDLSGIDLTEDDILENIQKNIETLQDWLGNV